MKKHSSWPKLLGVRRKTGLAQSCVDSLNTGGLRLTANFAVSAALRDELPVYKMPTAVGKATTPRTGRRRSVGGRRVLSDRKNTPTQHVRKTPLEQKTTPKPRRSASADSPGRRRRSVEGRGRHRSNSTISTTRSSSAQTKLAPRRISTEPETPFGKAEAMAAAAAHMLKLKDTPPPKDVDGTPFSKAEALAAAASHILTLRSRRDEEEREESATKMIGFAPGPLGIEFEPATLDDEGTERGCVVVKVHESSQAFHELRPGDVLVSIDSASIQTWPFARVVDALKTRADDCSVAFSAGTIEAEPSKSLFMKTPAADDPVRAVLDARGAADLALFSTCAKIEDLQTAMPVPALAPAEPAAREPLKSDDADAGTFATPLLAAELRALHDELAVAASDNVSLADALERKRRVEREAHVALNAALSPDKRPPCDEALSVFATRVADALRRAKDELQAARGASEDLDAARRLADEAAEALRKQTTTAADDRRALQKDCDARLAQAADMSRDAAAAFREAVDVARRERDAVTLNADATQKLLKKAEKWVAEAERDVHATTRAYSDREAALTERCDAAERRGQEIEAELATARRDTGEWKRSAQDFEETSLLIERKVAELETTVQSQRSDSARKSSQWEQRCEEAERRSSELEVALEHSARDFETSRSEADAVTRRLADAEDHKRALEAAIADQARGDSEAGQQRDRQVARLEAALERGAARAQQDQDHADELCRSHAEALRARDAQHAQKVDEERTRCEHKLQEAHGTHASELDAALQRAQQEAEAARRRDAAYASRRYDAAEVQHADAARKAVRDATVAERVAGRAARDASEARLRQTIATAVQRADNAAAERDDAQFEAERAGAAATRKALVAADACFAGRLADTDRAAAACCAASVAEVQAGRAAAVSAERAAGDAARLLAVAAARDMSEGEALGAARRDAEVFKQRSLAANDRAAEEVRNARRAEGHAKASEARRREAEGALDLLQRSSNEEAARLELEAERLGLDLVAMQDELDVRFDGEGRQCRANDALAEDFDALKRDRDAQKASYDLAAREVSRLSEVLSAKDAQLQDADADGLRALDVSQLEAAKAQASEVACHAAQVQRASEEARRRSAEARVLSLEADVSKLQGERDDATRAAIVENAAAYGDRQALVELAQARQSRDAEFFSVQAVCAQLRADVQRLEAKAASSLAAAAARESQDEAALAATKSADTLRREAALAVAAVRAEARRELSKSDKGRAAAEAQLQQCLAELRDKNAFVQKHREQLKLARTLSEQSDERLHGLRASLKREVREAVEAASEARADAEVAVASARGEALRLEDEVERLSSALRGRDASNAEAEHLAHDLLTMARENDQLRTTTEDAAAHLLEVSRDHDHARRRSRMHNQRARKVEAEMEAVGSRVATIAREVPERVKAIEQTADAKVVDAAARALDAEERAEEAVSALRDEEGARLRTERRLSDADTRSRTAVDALQAAEARSATLAQQLHAAEIQRLKTERALRDAEKLGERLIGERQAVAQDRDAAVAARDALAGALQKARGDARERLATTQKAMRAQLAATRAAKAAADAACAAARTQCRLQAQKRVRAAEQAGAELIRVADGLAASDRAAKTLTKRLQGLEHSATGPVAVELRALARSLDASQRDTANARKGVAAAEAKRAAGGFSAPEEQLRDELSRARDRAGALEKDLEEARRALDQKDGKVQGLKTFNSTICAFIESIAADEVNSGGEEPPPPPPSRGKAKQSQRRARRALAPPNADSPSGAWR